MILLTLNPLSFAVDNAAKSGITDAINSGLQSILDILTSIPQRVAVQISPLLEDISGWAKLAFDWVSWILFGDWSELSDHYIHSAVDAVNGFANTSFDLGGSSIDIMRLVTPYLYEIIPSLPTSYPYQTLGINIRTLSPLTASIDFGNRSNVSISASVRTTIYANQSIVFQIDTNFSASVGVSWNATEGINFIAAHSPVQNLPSHLDVNITEWSNMIAGLAVYAFTTYSPSKVVGIILSTPLAKWVSLLDATQNFILTGTAYSLPPFPHYPNSSLPVPPSYPPPPSPPLSTCRSSSNCILSCRDVPGGVILNVSGRWGNAGLTCQDSAFPARLSSMAVGQSWYDGNAAIWGDPCYGQAKYCTATYCCSTSPPLPPPQPPSPPPVATSCLSILSNAPSSPSGWYYISTTNSSTLRVWCDMVTDGGGYTLYPCAECTSVYMQPPFMNNSCTSLGLSLVIPRTKAHWQSMFDLVSNTLGAPLYAYFRVLTGIVKPVGGYNPCLGGGQGIMNYGNCSGVANSWKATDGGMWWVRDTAHSEPQGDYTANCFLGIDWTAGSLVASDIKFYDQSCGPSTGSYYMW